MAQTKATPMTRREWRHEKSATLCVTLRGIAALEDTDRDEKVLQGNDVGRIRNYLCGINPEKRVFLDKALQRAAIEFERANPKPKK